jgi:hypothetical protein
MLVLDMIENLTPLGKYKYNTWRILPMKCYIDNSVRLRSCIRNVNRDDDRFCSSFGEGASSWWWTSGDGTRSGGGDVTSLLMPSG